MVQTMTVEVKADQEFEFLARKFHRETGMEIYSKDQKWTALWKLIHGFLTIITIGKMRRFYTGFITTSGNKVFFPAGWDRTKVDHHDCQVLRHENKHIKQMLKCGLGNIHLGSVVFTLLYLFFPLPIGFAWFRYKMERDAYLVSYFANKEYGLSTEGLITRYADLLSGPSYFWTWANRDAIVSWFSENIHK